MKMKYLRNFGLLSLLLLGVFFIFEWDNLISTYHYLESKKPVNKLKYYQNPQRYFNGNVIYESKNNYKFKVSDALITLPETFTSGDSTVRTQKYLEDFRYESLLVIQNGEIIYENYWNGLTKETPHSAFSITKTMLGVLVGVAIDDGLIKSKDDLITNYLPEFENTWYRNVTIDHCLDMISGVKWEDDIPMLIDYVWLWAWNLTSAKEYLLQRESWHEPGTFRVYNSMDPLMIGLVLKSVIGDRTLSGYMQEKLWLPLGAEDNSYLTYFQEDDVENVIFGFSATTRDLAKFGQMWLQNGNWNGHQIISEDWVDQSFIAHREDNQPRVDAALTWFYDTYGWGYNNFWWIPDDTSGDEVFAHGIDGQLIYINRAKNVVIVSFRSNPEVLAGYNGHFANRSMVDFAQAISESIE